MFSKKTIKVGCRIMIATPSIVQLLPLISKLKTSEIRSVRVIHYSY